MKKLVAIATAAVLALTALTAPAGATLVQGDFLAMGDGYLITDTATQLEWLTPYYTRSHVYNDAYIQGLITNYGFRYATAAETLSMLNDNFGNPPVGSPGNAAGYAAAAAYFAIFGLNENVNCSGPPAVPCPRSQGLTADPGSNPNSRKAFGLIQFGSNGWMIVDNPWPESTADTQMGSFLVRAVPVCGNGSLEFGEDCDLGGDNGDADNCCTASCEYRAAGETCRATTSACDPAEECSGASDTCPADGPPAATVGAPKLIVRKLNTPVGDDKLTFKGETSFPPTALAALDPLTSGASLIVEDSTQATVISISLPGGAYDSGTHIGWKVNNAGTRWLYLNPTGLGVLGITKMLVIDKSSVTPGRVLFRVVGKNGAYAVAPGNLPVDVAVYFDPSAGACALASFPGLPFPACAFNAPGSTLKCR